jgi:hypothetical protein
MQRCVRQQELLWYPWAAITFSVTCELQKYTNRVNLLLVVWQDSATVGVSLFSASILSYKKRDKLC